MLRAGTSVDPIRWSQKGEWLMQQKLFNDVRTIIYLTYDVGNRYLTGIQALLCYKRAGDTRGQTIAQAFLFEEKGRCCQTADDFNGFTTNIQSAANLFLFVQRPGDAARNLERLGKLREVASKSKCLTMLDICITENITSTDLWFEMKQYARSAAAFEKAGLFKEAVGSYELIGKFDEAAMALRSGNHFNDLVSYLNMFVAIPTTLVPF